MAGVLGAGVGAALSHRSAGELWELGRWGGSTVEVTAPGYRCSRPGLRIRESSLPADEISVKEGIPVTTIARTLLDLGATLPRHRLRAVINETERRGVADRPSLPELLARHAGRRGTRAIRAVLAERRLGLDTIRSELESRFLEFLGRHALPRPELNAQLELGSRRLEVDCLWRAERLVAELDGHAHHSSDDSYEADRARDRALIAAGYLTMRVTWQALVHDGDRVAAELRSALARRTST